MSQFSLFGESALTSADPPSVSLSNSRKQSTKAERIASAKSVVVQTEPKLQSVSTPALAPAPIATPDDQPARWGHCRFCGWAIAIPGLDHSLCSNPTRTCGLSDWVADLKWLADNPEKSEKSGQKSGKGGRK